MGAVEKHGPHLPVVTDSLIGQYFCYCLDQKIQDEVLILPPIAIGCSRHHMDFAGTLKVSHNTFSLYVTEYWNRFMPMDLKTLFYSTAMGGIKRLAR